MVTTHVLVGLVVALPVVVFAPDHAPTALAAGVAGGFVPDLDVVAAHRKTLHHPVSAVLGAATCLPAAVVAPSSPTIGSVTFLAAVACHCFGDIASCGLGARPWNTPPSNRAIYDHVRGRWLPPRRWIRYDGAPEDLLVAFLVAVPLLVALEGGWQLLVVALLAVSVCYTLARKRLEDVARWLTGYLPSWFRSYVPERYLA
ncbi:hypothetical protein [Natronobacterium gregoryi]|nr:hypothetical protein [Natronobacterium gregoryi]ELY67891.1 membrane-bound metal-dependent hydrolase [Natronobacterium gregoryi SP2]PLK20003.1 hypothetical protein CYV19_11835 [Natronobacterium gregoryi SP2]